MAAAPAAADEMPSRMFCLPPVVLRDAASCALDDGVAGVLDRVRLTAVGRPQWWFVSEDNKPEDLPSLHRRLDELEHAVARRVEETCAAFFRTPQRAAGNAAYLTPAAWPSKI